MGKDNKGTDVTTPIREAPKDVREVITRVLKLEHDHLSADRPRIAEDVVTIIKHVVSLREGAS